MSRCALAAEFFGTFMLMVSVLAAFFYAFATPTGAAGIVGVALAVGGTVRALAFAIGHISGGHFNPAVTLGLVAGGRADMGVRRATSPPSASARLRPGLCSA